MSQKNSLPNKLKLWIEARKKYRLTNAQIQMARELGLNPKKFGKLSNNKQQRWKLPLNLFIEELYFKQFKKELPDNVKPIEQMAEDKAKKTDMKKQQSQA